MRERREEESVRHDIMNQFAALIPYQLSNQSEEPHASGDNERYNHIKGSIYFCDYMIKLWF